MVLPAQDMAAKLVDYFRHVTRVSERKAQNDFRRDTADQLSRISARSYELERATISPGTSTIRSSGVSSAGCRYCR